VFSVRRRRPVSKADDVAKLGGPSRDLFVKIRVGLQARGESSQADVVAGELCPEASGESGNGQGVARNRRRSARELPDDTSPEADMAAASSSGSPACAASHLP